MSTGNNNRGVFPCESFENNIFSCGGQAAMISIQLVQILGNEFAAIYNQLNNDEKNKYISALVKDLQAMSACRETTKNPMS